MYLKKRIRRCRFCDQDMTLTVSALSYSENPFCMDCLRERVSRSASPMRGSIKLIGRYFHFSEGLQTAETDTSQR